LLWYEEIVRICAEELNTSLICEYLYQLAKLFNHFYQKHQIISKDDEVTSFRLCLTNVVSKTLKNGLYLLGIDAPIQM
jgi:arginyl-tRNA synthetase